MRYGESVWSDQRGGSVERTVCGSKEVACEESRCTAAAAEGGWSGGGASVKGGEVLTKEKERKGVRAYPIYMARWDGGLGTR